jgi:hypothetical protein
MERALLGKDQEIEQANREMLDIKTKTKNSLYFAKEFFQPKSTT